MAPTPPRPSARWRLFALILAALPTLVIAGLATWVLADWLAVRDRLGHWRLTVRDDAGADVGHGETDLLASAWTWDWLRLPPFVAFTARFNPGPCGTLTLEPATAARLGSTDASACTLENPGFTLWIQNGRRTFQMKAEMPGIGWHLILWPGLPGDRDGAIVLPDPANPPVGRYLSVRLTR
jgi:hypothetical protein